MKIKKKFCLQNNAAPEETITISLSSLLFPDKKEEEREQKHAHIIVQMYLNGSYPTSHEEWLQVGTLSKGNQTLVMMVHLIPGCRLQKSMTFHQGV